MKSLVEIANPVQKINIVRNILTEDGGFPNNSLLPLLLYQEACQIGNKEPAGMIKDLLETNQWTGSWIDSIYGDHHFHSTARWLRTGLSR